MNREETIKKYLKAGEKDSRLSGIQGTQNLPPDMPDALIFTETDCGEIISVLKNQKNVSHPVKRVVAQSCVNHPHLRAWLKNNGYIIYGEELWKEGDGFCETTAAVLESMAGEDEIKEAGKAAYAEVYFYGTEELYNEISLLLKVNNNQVLPDFLYSKINEAEKLVKEIDDNLPPLSEELLEKRQKAKLKIQELGIMGNSLYPID